MKPAYSFYPKSISGLTLMNDDISVSYDNNYNPITTFSLVGKDTIPVKNAYSTLYTIPDVLRNDYGVTDKNKIIGAIEMGLYEFDRELSKTEAALLTSKSNQRCSNEKSSPILANFVDENIAIVYCDINLTSDQVKQATDTHAEIDRYYKIYFVERNILVYLAFNGKYIKDPQPFLTDYLSQVFNSNEALFISESQIRTIDQARKFREAVERN